MGFLRNLSQRLHNSLIQKVPRDVLIRQRVETTGRRDQCIGAYVAAAARADYEAMQRARADIDSHEEALAVIDNRMRSEFSDTTLRSNDPMRKWVTRRIECNVCGRDYLAMIERCVVCDSPLSVDEDSEDGAGGSTWEALEEHLKQSRGQSPRSDVFNLASELAELGQQRIQERGDGGVRSGEALLLFSLAVSASGWLCRRTEVLDDDDISWVVGSHVDHFARQIIGETSTESAAGDRLDAGVELVMMMLSAVEPFVDEMIDRLGEGDTDHEEILERLINEISSEFSTIGWGLDHFQLLQCVREVWYTAVERSVELTKLYRE